VDCEEKTLPEKNAMGRGEKNSKRINLGEKKTTQIVGGITKPGRAKTRGGDKDWENWTYLITKGNKTGGLGHKGRKGGRGRKYGDFAPLLGRLEPSTGSRKREGLEKQTSTMSPRQSVTMLNSGKRKRPIAHCQRKEQGLKGGGKGTVYFFRGILKMPLGRGGGGGEHKV